MEPDEMLEMQYEDRVSMDVDGTCNDFSEEYEVCSLCETEVWDGEYCNCLS